MRKACAGVRAHCLVDGWAGLVFSHINSYGTNMRQSMQSEADARNTRIPLAAEGQKKGSFRRLGKWSWFIFSPLAHPVMECSFAVACMGKAIFIGLSSVLGLFSFPYLVSERKRVLYPCSCLTGPPVSHGHSLRIVSSCAYPTLTFCANMG